MLPASDDVFLNPVEDRPEVVADICLTVHAKDDVGGDWLGFCNWPAKLDTLFSKVESVLLADLGAFPAGDYVRHLLSLTKDGVRGIEHRVHVQLVMPEPDASNRVVSDDDAVGTSHAEDASPDLKAACAIVGVDEDGFDALADTKLKLALMGEAQEVALQAPAGIGADLSFGALREHPAITAESVHDLGGGDEAVASRHARAGVGCKC